MLRRKATSSSMAIANDIWPLWDLTAVAFATALTTATAISTATAANPSTLTTIAAASALNTMETLQSNNMYFTTSTFGIRTLDNFGLVDDSGGGAGGDGGDGGDGTATSMYLSTAYTNNTDWLNITNGLHNGTAMDMDSALSTTETPFVPYVMRPETYIVPILFAVIFIVGVLGNGTLIVVFLSVRQMRNVPNTYILSLALADLLVIVITVPLTSTVYTVESWPWGSFLCTLSEFIKDVSIGVSVFTLTALSGDRYFAIVDPLRKFHAHGGGKRATRMTIAIAISIWLLAILCGLPALLGTYVKKVEINSNKSFVLCYPFPDEWGAEYAKIMVLLRFLVYYAIPLIIIGAFYFLIAKHLTYSASVPGEMQGAVRQVRARRKVAVTVLAFVVIFGICFLPYHVFMLWFYFWPTAQNDYNSFWHVLRILGFCLSFANSCANPVALYFVSGAFRKHFNRYLFCHNATGRHKKRHDTLCMHRDTSLTSTASKRYYSRRSCHHQSTMRSRLAETTITVLPNGNPNGLNNMQSTGGLATSDIDYNINYKQQQQKQERPRVHNEDDEEDMEQEEEQQHPHYHRRHQYAQHQHQPQQQQQQHQHHLKRNYQLM